MSKKEKDVDLIPFNNGWKVKHDGKEGDNPSNYPKIEFAMNSGPHLVVMQLPQNSTATFNKADPIWVKQGTTSPLQSGVDPEIADYVVSQDGKTLVLLDLNSGDPTTLSYRIKADGYGPILDPIIENKGGIGGVIDPPGIAPGGGYSESQYITAAAIALLVGILIGFVVHKMFFGPKPVG